MEAESSRRQTMRESRAMAALVSARSSMPSQEEVDTVLGWLRSSETRACSRAMHNALIEAGVEPDGRGRWAVDSILDWRGQANSREALVQYAGFDRVTGLRHPPTWVPIGRLSTDLQKEGRLRPQSKRVGVAPRPPPAFQSDGSMRRVSTRAGREPPDRLTYTREGGVGAKSKRHSGVVDAAANRKRSADRADMGPLGAAPLPPPLRGDSSLSG